MNESRSGKLEIVDTRASPEVGGVGSSVMGCREGGIIRVSSRAETLIARPPMLSSPGGLTLYFNYMWTKSNISKNCNRLKAVFLFVKIEIYLLQFMWKSWTTKAKVIFHGVAVFKYQHKN